MKPYAIKTPPDLEQLLQDKVTLHLNDAKSVAIVLTASYKLWGLVQKSSRSQSIMNSLQQRSSAARLFTVQIAVNQRYVLPTFETQLSEAAQKMLRTQKRQDVLSSALARAVSEALQHPFHSLEDVECYVTARQNELSAEQYRQLAAVFQVFTKWMEGQGIAEMTESLSRVSKALEKTQEAVRAFEKSRGADEVHFVFLTARQVHWLVNNQTYDAHGGIG